MNDYPNGLTVKELKELIKDWPETDHNGENNEVWIASGRFISDVVKYVKPLNKRINDNGSYSADIILQSD